MGVSGACWRLGLAPSVEEPTPTWKMLTLRAFAMLTPVLRALRLLLLLRALLHGGLLAGLLLLGDLLAEGPHLNGVIVGDGEIDWEDQLPPRGESLTKSGLRRGEAHIVDHENGGVLEHLELGAGCISHNCGCIGLLGLTELGLLGGADGGDQGACQRPLHAADALRGLEGHVELEDALSLLRIPLGV